ncbi:3-keto-5-aminohexanoate cleavage protein [Actinoplanes couchii]|uniref:3-keto-5-aminohexanoate cleavage enzyme n=1 Tax=Actinoplanes couchii TaxID=403638 RepID=A0ABQ3XAE0_9ACTN|nr:3-keto-5-aminohexanoate cleavage protein [Actinoplanes couchii]MDR6324925.1 uncharacterized protein (DUF849 family) [Actinoplanes couchii]GID55454.1 hypothetical protein Aco03nite_038580 [Actinoplanes couchii]
MTGTLITVAPTGADTAGSLAALVATAKESEALGAAAIDVPTGDDPGRLRETVAALRESTGLIIRAGAGGEMALCPPGDAAAYSLLWERGVVPVHQIVDAAGLDVLRRLLDERGLPAGRGVHVELVLGVPGGMPGTAAAVVACERVIRDLPPGTTFSATGLDRGTLPVMLTALATGGHLRVGTRDTLSYAENRPVDSDMQLVARAVGFAQLAQRPPLTSAQARDLLGVPPR